LASLDDSCSYWTMPKDSCGYGHLSHGVNFRNKFQAMEWWSCTLAKNHSSYYLASVAYCL